MKVTRVQHGVEVVQAAPHGVEVVQAVPHGVEVVQAVPQAVPQAVQQAVQRVVAMEAPQVGKLNEFIFSMTIWHGLGFALYRL